VGKGVPEFSFSLHRQRWWIENCRLEGSMKEKGLAMQEKKKTRENSSTWKEDSKTSYGK